MKALEIVKTVLTQILYQDIEFQHALRSVFKEHPENKEHSSLVSAIVGCALRHQYLFERIVKDLGNEYSDEQKCLLYASLANNLFLKRIEHEEMIGYVRSEFNEEQMVVIEKLLAYQDSPRELIPESIPNESYEYLSLRFNTPEWLVKMWQKHFGRGITYKLLKKNNKPQLQSCRVNTLVSSVKEVLDDNPEFRESPIADMVIYQGKAPIRKNNFFQSFDVFLLKMAVKDLMDKVCIENVQEAFLYSSEDNSVIRELFLKYHKKIGLNVGVPNVDERLDISKIIRYNQLTNVNFFGAEPTSMKAAISRPQDLVIVHPRSSNFDLIRAFPDYLLHFKRESIDELVAKQKEALNNCATFVGEDGVLVYMVSTINRKEGHSLIMDFLDRNRDFILIEEKQKFPFDSLDTALFYAIMKRKVEEIPSE
ncbi:MAG: hypothetical protein WCX85_01505 [Bacilli bacterium]|jgi:16S rRNA (cytosine967-C5)-methyltransferase|nr:hypothetical protein [Bacilli bacterium]